MELKRVLIFLALILAIPLISAELKIEKNVVTDAIIPEINNPAVFDLKITNLGEEDIFRIYSLVGINIKPNESFSLQSGATKEIQIELSPEEKILETPGTFNFIYKIKGEKTLQEDVIAIRIVNLKDALEINSYNINLDSDRVVVYVKNKIRYKFDKIKAGFHSAFFDFDKEFELNKEEKQEFDVAINREEAKKLIAGEYILTAEIETSGVKEKIENYFKFSAKSEISTKESRSGIIIRKTIIEKTNDGNLPTLVQIKIKKDIFSRLFTTFNIEPSSSERKGLVVEYVFQKEIRPAEIFTAKANTNWLYLLIILVAIILTGLIVNAYTSTYVILHKRTSFVKAKGGEFALKISLLVRARKFVENIKIIDKIPQLVKIYERFGTIEPDRIDEKNKRLEWNMPSLQAGEERIFSYIVYSKVAPIGKFELPTALATYERDGKMHEAESNRAFFFTEPRKSEEY